MFDLTFFLTNILLGLGLAMDAFSVSLANGLHEPKMRLPKMLLIAGIFAFFQAMMPMIGWICIRTVLQYFEAFEIFIPWIALVLLLFIGGKMLLDGIRGDEEYEDLKVGIAALLLQAVATSIDALSAGFAIKGDLIEALVAVLVIAVVTFVICLGGIFIGKKFGTCLQRKATIFGGAVLILVGIEIFLTGLLG